MAIPKRQRTSSPPGNANSSDGKRAKKDEEKKGYGGDELASALQQETAHEVLSWLHQLSHLTGMNSDLGDMDDFSGGVHSDYNSLFPPDVNARMNAGSHVIAASPQRSSTFSNHQSPGRRTAHLGTGFSLVAQVYTTIHQGRVFQTSPSNQPNRQLRPSSTSTQDSFSETSVQPYFSEQNVPAYGSRSEDDSPQPSQNQRTQETNLKPGSKAHHFHRFKTYNPQNMRFIETYTEHANVPPRGHPGVRHPDIPSTPSWTPQVDESVSTNVGLAITPLSQITPTALAPSQGPISSTHQLFDIRAPQPWVQALSNTFSPFIGRVITQPSNSAPSASARAQAVYRPAAANISINPIQQPRNVPIPLRTPAPIHDKPCQPDRRQLPYRSEASIIPRLPDLHHPANQVPCPRPLSPLDYNGLLQNPYLHHEVRFLLQNGTIACMLHLNYLQSIGSWESRPIWWEGASNRMMELSRSKGSLYNLCSLCKLHDRSRKDRNLQIYLEYIFVAPGNMVEGGQFQQLLGWAETHHFSDITTGCSQGGEGCL
ncbi:hypothetical protein K470DRAFT_263227 [Piedraia hortae CBS 480.64]|uniref:Uncharacterized protein n=1 Tax=Piedraia hortae CBS 480.64 TaxID=1314780 RepID=A0A6A7C3M4_9PEZI|nr:hypothetical protein K470DRAFT_263227 [Piedraia hortae CBS 480.64]